jgi:hypothetical protein
MSALLFVVALLSAGAVLVRCICVAGTLNAHEWSGHPFQFAGLAAGYALAGGGAVGMVLGWHHAPDLLLVGVACWVIFERRRVC